MFDSAYATALNRFNALLNLMFVLAMLVTRRKQRGHPIANEKSVEALACVVQVLPGRDAQKQ
jgi:hypothetical protein